MTFTTPSRTEIRDKMLRDLSSLEPLADVSPDSDWYVRATAHSGAAEGLYAHQQWIARQILPDECDEDVLLKQADWRGVQRRDASAASGPVVVSGATGGAVLPVGTVLTRADGMTYMTTDAATASSTGAITVNVVASAAGAAGSVEAGVSLSISTPPAGVPATAVSAGITGGEDVETLDGLRSRLKWRMRHPVAGGLPADYISWALEIPGVHRAWVYPLRRGDGTVDVAIKTRTGTASAQLVAQVQAHIDGLRPVMRLYGCKVLAPAPLLVPITGAWQLDLTRTTQAGALVALKKEVAAYFAELSPGDSVVRNQLIGIIAAVPGVIDFELTSPTTNVTTTVSADTVQIASVGNVTMTAAA